MVVRVKLCHGCGRLKRCTDGSDSEFAPNGFTRTGRRKYKSRCKACRAAARRKGSRTITPTGSWPRHPIGPFHDWLAAYQHEMRLLSYQALADALGIQAKRVGMTLSGRQRMISTDVVDVALMNAGRMVYVESLGRAVVTMDDLYPLEVADGSAMGVQLVFPSR